MKACGDTDVFPSSSSLGEYVSLERCEPTQWFNNHKGFTFFSDEPHHKGLVHLPLSESFEAEIRSPSTMIQGTTHNGIGGSRTATSDHQGSQPPHGRLGSKDPRVTSSQAFNFHESSWRAQTDAQSNGKSTNAQILHSQIPPKVTNAYGGRREEEQRREPHKNSKT